jgi:hypothetical protein
LAEEDVFPYGAKASKVDIVPYVGNKNAVPAF